LSKKICDLIIMRLDEFNSGVVTPQNLALALGKESFKTFVETYKHSELIQWLSPPSGFNIF